MINIILCGGSGTRLWPLSRTLLPKQFVKLFNNQSLFQATVLRNQDLCASQFIVSNAEQYFLAADQLEEIHISNNQYLLEPVGRNTAPAIALACMALHREELVLVTPSDHLIKDITAYNQAIREAETLAQENFLVTFGITPDYPETGFGYIEAQGNEVISFKEKPDQATAQAYMDQGNYYWNSGMFCFKAGIFLDQLQQHAPELFNACVNAYENARQGQQIRVSHEDMSAIPSDSIDYAVMEKSAIVKVVPCDISWSDLGSFDSLNEELQADNAGNTHLNFGEQQQHFNIDSSNNFIVSSNRTIATIDIDELMVIDTSDALLISKKGSTQKVREIVHELKQTLPELVELHQLVHRPWGSYEVLLNCDKYKIKRVIVKPGKKLSLQKHRHRNEHWVVVKGCASITLGDKQFKLNTNESTYIKMGEQHRLGNESDTELVIIEAQVGDYTGEDDIIRIADDYSRT